MRSALARLARLDPTRLDLALPRPWVCVLLVLAFLGFGVLVGRTVANAPHDTLSASVDPPLRLVLPPPTAAVPPASSQPSAPLPSVSTATPPSPEPSPEGSSESGQSTAGGESSQSGKGSDSKSSGAGGKGKGSGGKGSGGGGSNAGAGGGSGGGHGGSSGGEGGGQGAAKLPPIKHVFMIVLADEPYASVFGPSSSAPYLARTLEARGELLVRYYAVAHDELANGIALLSGQGPTPQTEVNCPTYAPVVPTGTGAEEQVLGQGCIYPSSTKTLMGELSAKRLTWKAYVEGMDSDQGSGLATCLHPAVGAIDATLDQTPPTTSTNPGAAANQVPPAYQAVTGDAYTTFRNPFMYFESVVDAPACAEHDVSLSELAGDLSDPARTPAFSYIVPSLCDDGSPIPCASGSPAGLPPADEFLRKVVPRILASKAYKHGGLLVITVDQAPSTGIYADSSSCCGQPRFPALPPPAALPDGGLRPPTGGGQVGALLLSPYVKSGTTNQEAFNHFSLLRTIENLFGLAHLGYAAASAAGSFGASVFSAYNG